MSRRILVTGPVQSLEDYAAAARESDWEAVELPLLEIRPRELDPADLPAELLTGAPDLICITSSNALDALATLAERWPGVRCAVVGEATAARVAQAGFELAGEPAPGAAQLAERLVAELPAGAHVLWPRGSLAHDLGATLRAAGLCVTDPVVYATLPRPVDGPVPAADAVLFASPSAVRRWLELEQANESEEDGSPPTAIAIGPTTLDAIHALPEGTFPAVLSLLEPSPAALRSCLESLPEAP